MRASSAAIVVLSLSLLACKGSSSASPPSGECEAALADTGSFSCSAGREASCEALAEDPEIQVTWTLHWDELPATERQRSCAQAWLDDQGLAHPVGDGPVFEVVASHAQIDALCRAAMIGACEPGDPVDTCVGLDETACESAPACTSIRARPIDAEAGCLAEPAFAGCMPAGRVCPAVVVTAEREDGGCWMFSSGCLPSEGWVIDSSACIDTISALEPCA